MEVAALLLLLFSALFIWALIKVWRSEDGLLLKISWCILLVLFALFAVPAYLATAYLSPTKRVSDPVKAAQEGLNQHGINEEVVWATHSSKLQGVRDFFGWPLPSTKRGILVLTWQGIYFIHFGALYKPRAIDDLDYSWAIEFENIYFTRWLKIGGHSFSIPKKQIEETASMIRRIRDARAQALLEDLKTCPQCAEEVKAAAQICRFCGYLFEAKGLGTHEGLEIRS